MDKDDMISRAAAIEWFFRPYSNEEYYSNLDVAKALKAIPAVDAAPVVHGRWVFHDDDMMPWVSCSECGVYTDSINKTPYCPYCAAKMDNGGEDGAVYSKLENAE